MSPVMSRCFSAALDYTIAGLHAIPLEPRGKRPLVSWKEYQERQPTVAELIGWWTAEPEANVGLVMGRGMFALDIDGPEGVLALAHAGIDLSLSAPCSRTAHGFHIFYAGTAPDKVGLLPKVDVRGTGYVVAPPSTHESGHVYSWARPLVPGREHLLGRGLPEAPAALRSLFGGPARTTGLAGDRWLVTALRDGAPKGQRDATCFRLASYLASKGLPPDVIEILLQPFADRCSPPFPLDQVHAKVVQATKYEIKRK